MNGVLGHRFVHGSTGSPVIGTRLMRYDTPPPQTYDGANPRPNDLLSSALPHDHDNRLKYHQWNFTCIYESTHYVQQEGQIHIFHPCTQFSNMNRTGFWFKLFKLNEYMIKTLIRPSTNWLSELCRSEYTIICLKIYLSTRDPPATCVELLVIHPQHPRVPPETCTKRENGSFHYNNITFDTYFVYDNATDIIYKKLTNNNRKYRNIMSKNVDFQTWSPIFVQ